MDVAGSTDRPPEDAQTPARARCGHAQRLRLTVREESYVQSVEAVPPTMTVARRLAGGAFVALLGLLLADLFQEGADLVSWARVPLWVVACSCALFWVATTAPLRPRLPSLSAERTVGGGWTVHVEPPQGSGRRRLKREAVSLAADIRAYLATQPPSRSSAMREHEEQFREMQAAETEEERTSIWQRHTQALTERSQRELQELSGRFGGRLLHVGQEGERLGLLDGSESSKLQWYAHSHGWLHEAANTLEALARRL
jgi:hypothetical protein